MYKQHIIVSVKPIRVFHEQSWQRCSFLYSIQWKQIRTNVNFNSTGVSVVLQKGLMSSKNLKRKLNILLTNLNLYCSQQILYNTRFKYFEWIICGYFKFELKLIPLIYFYWTLHKKKKTLTLCIREKLDCMYCHQVRTVLKEKY